jgi:hypothetical protein
VFLDPFLKTNLESIGRPSPVRWDSIDKFPRTIGCLDISLQPLQFNTQAHITVELHYHNIFDILNLPFLSYYILEFLMTSFCMTTDVEMECPVRGKRNLCSLNWPSNQSSYPGLLLTQQSKYMPFHPIP